jgi:probable aminopeptidase NPEPL1
VIGLQFPKDVAAMIRGSKTLLVVAPQSVFNGKLPQKALPRELTAVLQELAKDVKPGDLGAAGSTLTMFADGTGPRRVVAGVLPDKVSRYNSDARPEGIFRVVSAAGLAKAKESPAAILLIVNRENHLAAALNAVARAFPLFARQSSQATEGLQISIAAMNARGQSYQVPNAVRETIENARQAARLVDTPPSELTPSAFAEEARQLLSGLKGVKIQEIEGEALVEQKLLGIYSVGKAAASPPRLFVATYRPQKAKGPHVALVGKGITFDTGGLHLKQRGYMESMKSDMGGAAAVLGAFKTLVAEKAGRKLSLVICMAENAIGPGAYKPDDILTLHSGKTVEINNTDAEGRLLLADGVSYAGRILEAELIIDAATLTGAQPMSTGVMHAAVMSNDAALERTLVDAGYASGDLVHPLPFAPEFFQSEFKSPIADMRNSVKNRSNAQSSCAGQFIYSHIDDLEVRWGHVDLAGPAFRSDRGTGFGVALLAEAVRSLR